MLRHSNKLITQTSPYLLQHAANPVDWFPWGEEALQSARAENKLILVSIGYAACHWCHVMERESFEDPVVAAIMNEHFINIKIDREERPDIDAIYMDAVQMLTGSGGWPLNVFLTPDARPFYGGTYFPVERAFNRPSWKEVLLFISGTWREKSAEILTQAENLTKHIHAAAIFKQENQSETAIGKSTTEEITTSLLQQADKQFGGFGGAPKFPQTFSIQFLLRQYHFTRNEAALKQAVSSLDAMCLGGIYDQLAGGFSRYCVDAKWHIPHFEKMLYDNALLLSVLCEAFQITGKALYRRTVEQTMEFISKEWQSSIGGFYTAYDADSESEEGKFYTWTKEAIVAVLGTERAALFCAYYQVTEEGNWENTNILWARQTLEMFCSQQGLDIEATKALFDEWIQLLLAVRNQRPKPLLDDKIIMGWNALMITACCKAYAVFLRTDYLQMAEKAFDCIEKYLVKPQGGFHHNYKVQASNPAFLDDMAYYIQALIHLSEVTGKHFYLDKAKLYTEKVIEDFQDEATDFFFYTPVWQKDIIMRKKEYYDGAMPAGNSVMVWNLQYLSIVFDKKEWKTQSMKMVKAIADKLPRYPTSFGNWCCLLQQLVYNTHEIAIVGTEAAVMLKSVLPYYCPNRVLLIQSSADETLPIFQNKWTDETTSIFLCKDYSCKAPVTSAEALFVLLKMN